MPTFQGMASADPFALGIDFVVLVAAGLGILLSVKYIPSINQQMGEYYALLLLVAAGMMAMGSAMDLIVVFLALEIFSLGLYILSGLNRNDPRSSEAAMKYFLLGAFASALLCLRRGAALRRHRQHAVCRRLRQRSPTARPISNLLYPGHCAAHRRLWLQGEPRALPHVDARRLPGCADAGDGLHERGHQGRRLCRLLPTLPVCAAHRSSRCGAGRWPSWPC